MNKDGILVINKPSGYTSRDIVNIVSNKLGTKKVGHTGTLDKSATGVLVLLIGKYTKLTDYLVSTKKEYDVTFRLGYETDTLDLSGNIIKTSDRICTNEEIEKTVKSFKGSYMQEPPIYSAIHVNGKRLYKYATEKKSVNIPKRLVNIYEIGNIIIDGSDVKTSFTVSKGTYIRSLVRDIGNKLGTYATMTSLNRLSQGMFGLDISFTLDNIKNNNYKILTVFDIFPKEYFVNINEEKCKEIKNGVKQKLDIKSDIVGFIYKNELVAIYKRDDDYYKMLLKFK